MSLDTTSNLKQQLTSSLGALAPRYFESLQRFVTGRTSRTEFEEAAQEILTTPTLLQLHNALIISLFDATAMYRRNALGSSSAMNSAMTPPPLPSSKQPTRKRRRTLLPYQGPDMSEEERALRSNRLKRSVLAMGRRERERILSLQDTPAASTSTADGQVPPPAIPRDEILSERGVTLLPERGGAPGVRPPIQLHSTTHAPTLQHIAERINLICAQHNLAAPSRSVPHLMSLACEAKLKELITHAVTLTLSSQTIPSINLPSQGPSSLKSSLLLTGEHAQSTSLVASAAHHHYPHRAPILTVPAFTTLFTIHPSSLPNKSAAAMRMATLSTTTDDDNEDIPVLKDRAVRDQRWQIMALLAERSAVREALRAVR